MPQVNGDEWRNALDSLEHRIERQMRSSLQPIADAVKDIRVLQQTQNGRVGRLEEDRIRRDASDKVRAELAKEAVEVAATKAAEVASQRDWSYRKIAVCIAGAGFALEVFAKGFEIASHVLN